MTAPDLPTLRALAEEVVRRAPAPRPSYRPRYLPAPVVTAAPAPSRPASRAPLVVAATIVAGAVGFWALRSKPTSAPAPLAVAARVPPPAPAAPPAAKPVEPPPPVVAAALPPAAAPVKEPTPPIAPAPHRRAPPPVGVRKVALQAAKPAPETAPVGEGTSADARKQIDALVKTALEGKETRGEAHEEGGESLPALTRDDIVASMKPLRPRMKECYKQFGQRGLAMVRVQVGDDGQVAAAAVEGPFAGSPTGACVQAAVKTVRFPQSAGMTFRYPFPVR